MLGFKLVSRPELDPKGRALMKMNGNTILIAGRRRSLLEEVTAAHAGMIALELDIEDPDSIARLAEQVDRKFSNLNVLINNAGIMRNENLLSPAFSLDDAEATVVTNLLGPIRLTTALLPGIVRQPQGAILMVTSGLAYVPLSMTPTYCATKAAIHSYTQSLRYQLKATSVQVIELIPPYVRTELMGARQVSDPVAMPLEDFMAETMKLLATSPQANEICVDRVKRLRFAESTGDYEAFYSQFNEAMNAARQDERG